MTIGPGSPVSIFPSRNGTTPGGVGRILPSEYAASARTSAGLLSEDIDPVSGEQWGNFPQTYSMVGIIISALRLSRSWEDIV